MTALLRPTREWKLPIAMPAPRLSDARIGCRRTPALFPPESFGAAPHAVLESVARVGQLVVILPRGVLEPELERIDLQGVSRRGPSPTRCRTRPEGSPARGSSRQPRCSCRPGGRSSRRAGTRTTRYPRSNRIPCGTDPSRCTRASGLREAGRRSSRRPCSTGWSASGRGRRRSPPCASARAAPARSACLRQHRRHQVEVVTLVLVAEPAAHELRRRRGLVRQGFSDRPRGRAGSSRSPAWTHRR